VAASLLHAVGLDELVSDDAAGYRARVLQLAADPARRHRLRTQLLAQRGPGTLFDGAGFARDIEALYLRMWERATAGLAPAALVPEDALI
jgi:predicted O-linked N-acetylglucosamine transferase (SPINDLY family)